MIVCWKGQVRRGIRWVIILLSLVRSAESVAEHQSGRYVKEHRLSTGLTTVVAEGEFEPRSIGSYSIRLYGTNPEFPTDNFLQGIVRKRDGTIEQVLLHDLSQNGSEEIIVVIRSVGTGAYLSADAFQYHSGELILLTSVNGLGKASDPIQALIHQLVLEPKG